MLFLVLIVTVVAFPLCMDVVEVMVVTIEFYQELTVLLSTP